MSLKSSPYLQLVRPANLVTSATDVLGGVFLATLVSTSHTIAEPAWFGVIWLVCASILLYAGGIAMNDIADVHLDRVERPERPLPSGRISLTRALIFVIILLMTGILLAFLYHWYSGLLAIAITLFSYIYNKWSKHHALIGPLNMGILRGLNLLVGLSFIPQALAGHYLIAIIPIIYIFAITMVSRGEVHGSSSRPLGVALVLFILADTGILAIGLQYDRLWLPALFTAIHLLFVLPSLFKALATPSAEHIRQTVKRGVIGIIILDSVWVSMTDFWPIAFLMLILLPVSQKLGRYFSVT